MKKVITTTFSVSMLPVIGQANLRIREVSEDTFNSELGDDFESYVGHETTAKLLSEKLGKDIKFNRANLMLEPNMRLFVAVPQFRVEVAREFTPEEIEKAKFRYFIIELIPSEKEVKGVRVEFKVKDGDLYINDYKVLKAWESIAGWYWFGVEEVEPGLWFGLVQGFEDEWSYFDENELKELMKRGIVWEIKKQDLPFAGRRR